MYNSYSKITGLSFKESLFEAFKRSPKELIKNNNYDLYITHLMNYKHILLKQIIKRMFDQINVISN